MQGEDPIEQPKAADPTPAPKQSNTDSDATLTVTVKATPTSIPADTPTPAPMPEPPVPTLDGKKNASPECIVYRGALFLCHSLPPVGS